VTVPAPPQESVADKVARVLLDLVAQVPESDLRQTHDPRAIAGRMSTVAAVKAALAAGSLALPPGPLGWLTVLPEMVAVWRLQGKLVADIARVYGRTEPPTREQMLYCLFRHSAAQAVRDLVVRAGERVLVRRASTRALQSIARRIGVHVTERGLSSALARWLPLVGAVGVGGYAYYDTARVAATAVALFEAEAVVESEST
jgi:hypothetical protein